MSNIEVKQEYIENDVKQEYNNSHDNLYVNTHVMTNDEYINNVKQEYNTILPQISNVNDRKWFDKYFELLRFIIANNRYPKINEKTRAFKHERALYVWLTKQIKLIQKDENNYKTANMLQLFNCIPYQTNTKYAHKYKFPVAVTIKQRFYYFDNTIETILQLVNNNTIHLVENKRYVKWLNKQFNQMYDTNNKHYSPYKRAKLAYLLTHI